MKPVAVAVRQELRASNPGPSQPRQNQTAVEFRDQLALLGQRVEVQAAVMQAQAAAKQAVAPSSRGLQISGEPIPWRSRPGSSSALSSSPTSCSSRVPVFVMMPLDTVSLDGKVFNNAEEMGHCLKELRSSGVYGVMVDFWWSICEPQPGVYNFEGYKALCASIAEAGLKLQAVMSFHRCGGSIGDTLNIPLPNWVLETAKRNGLLYKDRHGGVSEDCLSLSADRRVVFPGRSRSGSANRDALTCYSDFMKAFAEAMEVHIQDGTIVEIQVGMGPCGELRYPSYMLSHGWNYPGVGLLMAHDEGMKQMLKDASVAIPPGAPSDTNSGPDSTDLFQCQETGIRGPAAPASHSGLAASFMRWYAKVLQAHGRAVLGAAFQAFPKSSSPALSFSVKISGIHWWHLHPSRAAEACAGYFCGGGYNFYVDIARMLSDAARAGGRPVLLNFTCLEMSNGANDALSAPEDLIAEVRKICVEWNVPMCGENALQFDWATSDGVWSQISRQARGWSSGRDRLHSFTLCRLPNGDVYEGSLSALKRFCDEI